MLVWAGLAILAATIWALVKRYETRFVLMSAGFLMAILAGSPMTAFDAFSKAMVTREMVTVICSVMGFAFVMKYTECDTHLTVGASGTLRYLRAVLVPGATLITFFVNIALPSAAGTAAAVGAVVIPLLVSQGVSPAMAASAVMMGTTGSLLSPGHAQNALVAKVAGQVYGRAVSVVEVIEVHYQATIIAAVVGAIVILAVAMIFKEHKGYVDEDKYFTAPEEFKVNPLYAIVPIIPIVLLILGAALPQQLPWLKKLRVEHAMIIGAVLGFAVTRKNPMTGTKQFFEGLGKGYSGVIGIIIAAGVFVGGMQAIGLIRAGIDAMQQSTHIAPIAAASGPLLLAVISGSGQAASLAFNEAITPHAVQLGMDPVILGWLSSLSGAIGRCLSPVAGATIVLAGLARVSPMEIAKRNAVPSAAAMIVAYFILMYVASVPGK